MHRQPYFSYDDFDYPANALWMTCSQRLLSYLVFQSVDWSVPAECYSRDASYALN